MLPDSPAGKGVGSQRSSEDGRSLTWLLLLWLGRGVAAVVRVQTADVTGAGGQTLLAEAAEPLPEGWTEHFDDEHGCYFYHNEARDEST
jgi:hypothetical protein